MDTITQREYSVIYDRNLSIKYGGQRFVIVDAQTKDVLDNAQGYGYKSAQNAHAAWSYKIKTPAQRKARAAAKRAVSKWQKKHPDIMEDIEDLHLQAFKLGEKVTSADVKDLLRGRGIDIDALPFSIRDLMR